MLLEEGRKKDVIFLNISVGFPLIQTSFPKQLFRAMSYSFLTPLVSPFNPSLSSLAWKVSCILGPRQVWLQGSGHMSLSSLPRSSLLTPHPLTAQRLLLSTQPLVLCWAVLRLLKMRFQCRLPLAVLLCRSLIINHTPQVGNRHLSCKPAESGPQTQVQHLLDSATSFWKLSSS